MNKVLLVILDGLWYSEDTKWNAVKLSNKKALDKIWGKYPTILINASWNACGLPEWEMGTSESWHITIWSWRIIWQPLEEINQSIKSWEFFNKKLLSEKMDKDRTLHLVWMLSNWWIHSHINHLFALLKIAKDKWVKNVLIHCIADWRDTKMDCIEDFLIQLKNKTEEIWIWKISDLVWRFYAMDRDNNVERTTKAFNLLTKWEWFEAQDINEALKYWYKKERNDYYIEPVKFSEYSKIEKEDGIIFFNFRSDRAAQLTKMFFENWFKNFLAFWPYTKDFPVLFTPKNVINNLSQVLANNWKTQLRIAETEKFAHVTFYLNSQDHEKQNEETHILIPSPKVSNYADKPEMSALEVTEKLVDWIKSEKYDFICVNYANPDLVWHSWDLKSSIHAIETIDKCLSEVIPIAQDQWYDIIITADHWNAEKMEYPNWDPCTTHTKNPVRFTLIGTEENQTLKNGNVLLKQLSWKDTNFLKFWLKDIAPTILDLMWIKKPNEMTGESLIEKEV